MWVLTRDRRIAAACAQIASQSDPNFRFVSAAPPLDGAYFYGIARDPIARGEAHELIDRSAYG